MTHGIQLNWDTDNPSGTTFKVYRGTASGQETLLAQGVQVNSYLDSNGNPGTTYFYEVSAVVAGTESAKSGEVSAVMPQLADPPSNLTATVV